MASLEYDENIGRDFRKLLKIASKSKEESGEQIKRDETRKKSCT